MANWIWMKIKFLHFRTFKPTCFESVNESYEFESDLVIMKKKYMVLKPCKTYYLQLLKVLCYLISKLQNRVSKNMLYSGLRDHKPKKVESQCPRSDYLICNGLGSLPNKYC